MQKQRIGFGTWALGGNAYGPVTERDAKDAISFSVSAGIDFFDTADIYGNGRAERILGETLCGHADVRIATKAGYLTEEGTRQDFSEKYLTEALESSLLRLRRSCVDLILLHSPPIQVLETRATARTLNRLCANGLARSWGVSLRSIDHFSQALYHTDCAAIEVILNLLDQRAIDSGLLQKAKDLKVDVIARVPLCFGFLSGKYRRGSVFPNSDHRSRWPESQREKWIAAAERFAFLEKRGRSLLQGALAFCLAWPGVSIVIPGMKRAEQVRHNMEASSEKAQLTQNEIKDARAVWREIRDLVPQ